MNENDFELLYHYEQLENNSTITFRIPTALKEDFIQYAGSKGFSKVLREFMVNYISERKRQKE
ncbi:MAG: hypothetical protein HUJ83_06445 [Veillonella sp.]|nr:hypothetical protein [Veillonella sp.]